MHFSCAALRKRVPWTHIALVGALTLLLSGWTCSAIFVSCQGIDQQPQIAVLSPDTIPGDTNSVLLTVDGSGFTSQSQILWNGNSLQTTFLDSTRLQTTVTQRIFESFGGTPGSSVSISVTPGMTFGCLNGGNSNVLLLAII